MAFALAGGVNANPLAAAVPVASAVSTPKWHAYGIAGMGWIKSTGPVFLKKNSPLAGWDMEGLEGASEKLKSKNGSQKFAVNSTTGYYSAKIDNVDFGIKGECEYSVKGRNRFTADFGLGTRMVFGPVFLGAEIGMRLPQTIKTGLSMEKASLDTIDEVGDRGVVYNSVSAVSNMDFRVSPSFYVLGQIGSSFNGVEMYALGGFSIQSIKITSNFKISGVEVEQEDQGVQDVAEESVAGRYGSVAPIFGGGLGYNVTPQINLGVRYTYQLLPLKTKKTGEEKVILTTLKEKSKIGRHSVMATVMFKFGGC